MINITKILFFIIILISTYGISFIIPQIKELKIKKSLEIVIRYALGLGIISYIYFFLTLTHLLKITSFYLVVLSGLLLFLFNFRKHNDLKFKINDFKNIFFILTLIFISINFFYSLFYPTFYDSMLYHLAVPSYYFQNNGFKLWENNFLSNLPLTIEFYYLFLISGKFFMLSKLINFISSIGIIIVILNLFKTENKKSFLLILIFYSLPQFGFLSSSSKPDITSILFVLLTFYLFLSFTKNNNKTYLILSSIFSGLSISSKYINAFYIFSMILTYLILNKITKKTLIYVLIFSIISFVIISPWLIKNTVLTSNPVYPYLNKLFHSKYWTLAQTKNFSSTIKRGNFTIIELIKYPFVILTKPFSYGLTAVYGYLFITLLIFSIYYKKEYEIKFILISSLLSFILLLLISRVPRYFLTSFILLSIPIYSGIERFFNKRRELKIAIKIIVIILALTNIYYQINLQEMLFRGIKYLKYKSRYKYVEYLRILPYYNAFSFLNKNLNNSDKVCFLGEDRSFYLKKPFDVSSFNDKNKILTALNKSTNFELFIEKLKKHNITHILFSEKGLDRMSKMSYIYNLKKEEKERLFDYFSKLNQIYKDKRYVIYKLIN